MERPTVVNGTTHLRNRDGVAFLRPDPPAPPEDSEISIFDAKKYFNEPNLDQKFVVLGNNNNRVSPVMSVNVDQCRDDSSVRLSSASSEMGYRNYRTRSFHATPTASSEASWNSQTGLLTNPTGAVPVKIQDKQKVRPARWLFGRKCPCAGKKSVQVQGSEPKTPNRSSISVPSPNSNKPKSKCEECDPEIVSISRSERVSAPAATGFTFPVLGPAKLALPEPPRDSVESLEVFRPSNRGRQAPDGRIFAFPTSPRGAVEDDVASDASSDLFEIESFSAATTTTTTSYPAMMTCPRRESLDEAASFNAARRLGGGVGGGGSYCRRSIDEAAECYEPSEASIDWSVTTAEGFERGSVAGFSVAAAELEEAVFDRVGGGKKRGNGLLSCRCEKAVSVVGPNPQPVGPKWVPPTTTVVRVGGGIGHRKPPLGRSGSARLSLAFAT